MKKTLQKLGMYAICGCGMVFIVYNGLEAMLFPRTEIKYDAEIDRYSVITDEKAYDGLRYNEAVDLAIEIEEE